MSPHEFILKSVSAQLEKEGYPQGVSFIAAEDALEFYKRQAMFKKNAIEDCVKHARKKANELGAKKK